MSSQAKNILPTNNDGLVFVSVVEAHEMASKAWIAYNKANGKTLAGKRCKKCKDQWRPNVANGLKPPPRFPPNYEGNCPVCGSELTFSSMTF
jgi:hypothetical protein